LANFLNSWQDIKKCCVILGSMRMDWLGPRGVGEGAERPGAGRAFGDCLAMASGMTSRLVCQARRSSPEAVGGHLRLHGVVDYGEAAGVGESAHLLHLGSGERHVGQDEGIGRDVG